MLALPLVVAAAAAAPVLGKAVTATPLTGHLLVKPAGSPAFAPLDAGQSIPVGSIVDARKGRAKITVASDAKGHTQSATFYGGIFKVLQKQAARPVAEMRLVESLQSCRGSRHLWGDGKGRFRTRGRYAAATVHGTQWVMKDTCSSTTTVVARGTVQVEDFVRHTTVTVRAGHRYGTTAR